MCVCVFSSEEPLKRLPQKVSASLAKVLEKMDLSNRAEQAKKGVCASVPLDEHTAMHLQ